MRRSKMYKKVNSSIFNHVNSNIVYPTIFFDPIVLNEEIKTGVEIIEIYSDEGGEIEQGNTHTLNNTWCTFNSSNDDYIRNKSFNRCMKPEHKHDTKNYAYDDAFDKACTELYSISYQDKDQICSKQFPSIIENPDSFDTSSGDIEVIQFDSTLDDSYNSHKAYNDCHAEKNIYFENNKQYVFENDLQNSSNQESSCSTDYDDEPAESFTAMRRIATPNPTYIPRLHLPSSPTLPTVTEVTEPNKPSVKLSRNNITEKYNLQSNSWFNNNENGNKSYQNNKTSNGHRLSSLSERERRRKRLKEIQEQECLDVEDKTQINSYNVSNVIVQNKTEDLKTNQKDDKLIHINTEESIDTKEPEQYHNVINKINTLPTLQIKVSPSKSDEKNILTYIPIVKAEGVWFDNNKENTTIEVYDCDLDATDDSRTKEVTKSTPRNTSLLKQCLTVKSIVPSLHLSFASDADEGKSWFKRLLNFFRCCK